MSYLLPIAQLLHLLGRVDGRKKMQKIVHILQELGYSFGFRFEYSFYGMYSQQLRGALDRLEDEKLLTENPSSGQSYVFEASPKLNVLLPELGFTNPPLWADAAKRLNRLSAQEAEGVSTILYLERFGYSGDKLKSKLLELKPHLENIYPDCERSAEEMKAFAAQ